MRPLYEGEPIDANDFLSGMPEKNKLDAKRIRLSP